MNPQLTLLDTAPEQTLLQPVANCPHPKQDALTLAEFIRSYRGNKPMGGMWTSTYRPNHPVASDWQEAWLRNHFVRIAYPRLPARGFLLTPEADLRLCVVDSLADAALFTARYRLGRLRIPSMLRAGPRILLTDEVTDWERCFVDCDAVQLTERAADAVAKNKIAGGEATAFDTWNCESALFARWRFCGTKEIKLCVNTNV